MRIISHIRNHMDLFSKSEKVIADVLIRDTIGFSLKSVGKLSEELDLSKTTFIRFAKKLGFDGYAEFRKVLQEEAVLHKSLSEKLQTPMPEKRKERLERLREMELYNINDTLGSIDPAVQDRFIRRIAEADLIFTLGWGVSFHLADLFGLRMTSLGKKVIPLRRENFALPERAVHFKEKEILLIFEFPKYSVEVLETATLAHDRGAEIHLFTNSRNCPIVPFAESTFLCTTLADSFGNSLIGPISLINFITSEIWLLLKDQISEGLIAQSRILDDSRYYIS